MSETPVMSDVHTANKSIIAKLKAPPPHSFKLKVFGPVSHHLGNDYFRDADGTLCAGPKKHIEKIAVL